MQRMWKWLIRKAKQPLASITNSSPLLDVQSNTQILQSRALIALASYVVEQNGTDPTTLTITDGTHDIDMPSAEEAVDSLRTALLPG